MVLFGVCRKLLTNNGMEFKNELFSQVAEQLGVERKIYTPPYRPQSNGRIEGFHNFLKSCLAKHISRNREWDDVAPLATTASYNWHCLISILCHTSMRGSHHLPDQLPGEFKGITFLCYVWQRCTY